MIATAMIVDDSRTARMFVRRCLEIAGCGAVAKFLEAGHGKEALDLLFATPGVDLVITDINMPIMDGLALVEAMKKDPRTKGIPVIVVTSLKGVVEKSDSGTMGALAVIEKPLTPQKLAEALKLLK